MALTLAERLRSGGLPTEHVVELGDRDVREVPVPAGARVFVTPEQVLVGPFTTGAGCGRCLAVRWQGAQPTGRRSVLEREAPEVRTRVVALGATTVAVVGALLRRTPAPSRRAVVVVLDHADPRPRQVELLPVPGCPGCGGPAPSGTPVGVPTGYRVARPRDLDLPTAALVNPVLGVLGARTGVDLTSPAAVPAGGSFTARGARGFVDIGWGGQGASLSESRTTGLLEGLERHAGTDVRHGGPVRRTSLRRLGDEAFDVTGLGVEVVAGREFPTREGLPRLPEDAVVDWVPARSLRDGRELWLPKQLAHYHAENSVAGFVQESSSGCAVGGSPAEAALHALLELVERDAFLLTWYRGLDLPEIDLAGVEDTTVRHTLRRSAHLGLEVRAFDARVDLPFPVVLCTCERPDGGPGAFNVSAAASLDPLRALRSALAEITARTPVLIEECTADPHRLDRLAADPTQVATLSDHAVLAGSPGFRDHAAGLLTRRERHPPTALFGPARHLGDVTGALDHVVAGLAVAGLEAWTVDQTSDEQRALGLTTVRAVVPGLLPIDFGWHRQRALGMPRMGWAQPTASPVRLPQPPAGHRRLVPHPFP